MVTDEIEVAGIAKPVRIVVDKWGIPHIRAESMADMFFAQGFNAARDRLWQIDLWRKRGLGLLAEDFGSGYLAQDRASRLFLYRGDMDADWAVYAPDAREICEHFVDGINAYIDLLDEHPDKLPPEFVQVGDASGEVGGRRCGPHPGPFLDAERPIGSRPRQRDGCRRCRG